MKKIVYGLMSMIVLMSAYSCSSGHYVSARPETVIVTRPAQPRPNYVWVDGDYYWSGGRYVARPGYWAAPKSRQNLAFWNLGTSKARLRLASRWMEIIIPVARLTNR